MIFRDGFVKSVYQTVYRIGLSGWEHSYSIICFFVGNYINKYNIIAFLVGLKNVFIEKKKMSVLTINLNLLTQKKNKVYLFIIIVIKVPKSNYFCRPCFSLVLRLHYLIRSKV